MTCESVSDASAMRVLPSIVRDKGFAERVELLAMEHQDMVISDVGDRLVRLRTERGHSLDDAAAAAGIDPETLAAAEAGESILAEAHLRALADAYSIDPARSLPTA
jgi:ribosome-binding protein aMBF1 (putative translation factor)